MALDPDDRRPESVQIADAIRAQISTGELKAGERVPSVRTLAAEFGVAEMTAQKAKQAVEAEGLIITRPGKGSFVVESVGRPKDARSAVTQSPASGHADTDELGGKLAALAEQVSELAARVSALEHRG